MQPHTYVIYNEVSKKLKRACEKYTVNYQLVPPHSHRANNAERAIQTFKNNFKAGLATIDPEHPIANWDILLTKSVMTLNMLLDSILNSKISAYTHIFSNYDFNNTPIVSSGTKVVVYSKPD